MTISRRFSCYKGIATSIKKLLVTTNEGNSVWRVFVFPFGARPQSQKAGLRPWSQQFGQRTQERKDLVLWHVVTIENRRKDSSKGAQEIRLCDLVMHCSIDLHLLPWSKRVSPSTLVLECLGVGIMWSEPFNSSRIPSSGQAPYENKPEIWSAGSDLGSPRPRSHGRCPRRCYQPWIRPSRRCISELIGTSSLV